MRYRRGSDSYRKGYYTIVFSKFLPIRSNFSNIYEMFTFWGWFCVLFGGFGRKVCGLSYFVFCPPRTTHKRCSRDTSCESPAPKRNRRKRHGSPLESSPAGCRRKWGMVKQFGGLGRGRSLVKQVQSASFYNGRAESHRYTVRSV